MRIGRDVTLPAHGVTVLWIVEMVVTNLSVLYTPVFLCVFVCVFVSF